MKALIIYFTMGGRTKKTGKAIASALTNYDVSYIPIELTGSLTEKIKLLDKFQNGDFSDIEADFYSLDVLEYDLIIFGMPTYGNFPPKVFDEIIAKIKNLGGKKVVVYNTARLTGGKSLEYMKEKVEEKGGRVIDFVKFRKLFWIGNKDAIKFGKKINQIKE